MDKLYTVEQAADVFQVSKYTIRTWMKDGLLVGNKLPNGQWRITEENMKNFANNKYGDGETDEQRDRSVQG